MGQANINKGISNDSLSGISDSVSNDTAPKIEEATTIQIKLDTKFCLDQMKIIKREPYDQVIKRLLVKILDNCEEGFDKKTRELIKNRIQEVNRGEVVSTKELRDLLFGGEDNEIRKGLGKINKK